jgi:RND family efflux transporter MFP subunit
MMNETVSTAPNRTRGKVAGLLAVASLVGLAVLIGGRVKETLADRAKVVAAQETDAKTRQAQSSVAVVAPVPATWRPVILATGSLAPYQEADVGFKMGGRLAKVNVDVGAVVKTGKVLAVVEASEASAQSSAASAGVRAAEIGVEMAQDAKRRTDKLFESSTISELEKTTVDQKVKLAEAQLAQARAQARLAGTQVSNATLAAPFAGLVTRVPAGIGKIVGPGEPLFHLEDTSILKLNATLSEGDARLVEVGSEIVLGDRKGKITAVLRSLDPMTRRVPMVAEIPNADGQLFARSFLRATITAARDVPVFRLPATARKPGSQDEIVTIEGGVAKIKRVVLETAPDGALLVRDGVTASDVVVASPSGETTDGQPMIAGSVAQGAPPSPNAPTAPSGAPAPTH